ncbi:ribosome-associated translation inhibitor RaiA [Pediococcus acidilactici]|uniref:ribosome hibernation-promoting factor, HPF/YfiA family n=1 Tax=Pediococcus acidilactici TaxID=1254 RepID=UPI0013254F63|nr:ribosome-associated translation inhibitor RaiA [Pediococcus acidilactici]KAF0335524.1 ribosome-associated translation inhibitor RaiA [Pediococcus acidilactici]KAF0344996.1 ribosome-associated translation inhibitor RaiA [Pediococcus acidilactici]KAF0354361.1 ribosome-associated translation inhibitor RaiA [Pediococcus acidilactici]KAF0358407.1 ribosome-associated translation inhibitor RaiA [Pediococcus acidilactici]KAF0362837.1 ribosome-associated translation inhibitor RaiA [Pediococcus acidi
MLDFNVRGENIEVTESIRDYVEKRIGKIEKYFDQGANPKAHVNLKVYQDRTAKVEVTIPLPYLVLRAEETSPDLYASVDLVTDKLERQIRKYKTKINRKSRETGYKGVEIPQEDAREDEEEASEFNIVRTKQVSLKPMGAEEAILQMDMLGHNFFIYEDADTGSVDIVYRRHDGRYGLIESANE